MGFPQYIRFTPEEEAAIAEMEAEMDAKAEAAGAAAEAERVAQAMAAGYPEAVARRGSQRALRLYDTWHARRDALEHGAELPPLPEEQELAVPDVVRLAAADSFWDDPFVQLFMAKVARAKRGRRTGNERAMIPLHGMSARDCDTLERDLQAGGIAVLCIEEPSPGVFWLYCHCPPTPDHKYWITDAALFREVVAAGLIPWIPRHVLDGGSC
jgi:hypothetical protein